MAVPNKAFRLSKIDAHHTSSYNALTGAQDVATHAAALGVTTTEAQHRLSLLVDEALVVALKTAKGAPTGQYQAA